MIDTLLDACHFILTGLGEPQTCYWLASQMVEMRLWRATEADVRNALAKEMEMRGSTSRFVELDNDEFGLRSWLNRTASPQGERSGR